MRHALSNISMPVYGNKNHEVKCDKFLGSKDNLAASIDEVTLLDITINLNRLFIFNQERISAWLKATNEHIGGKAPIQLLQEGKPGDLHRFLNVLINKGELRGYAYYLDLDEFSAGIIGIDKLYRIVSCIEKMFVGKAPDQIHAWLITENANITGHTPLQLLREGKAGARKLLALLETR